MSDIIVPFLKWAGGKRWLTQSSPEIFPKTYERYIEPFLGGGAVYFHLKPKIALLADINEELITTYEAIRESWELVVRYLRNHQRCHDTEYFYELRGIELRSNAARAARMLYLNRTCWNGLYRVNLKGEFNVPIGTKDNVLLSSDNFKGISNLLSGSELAIQDFEVTIDQASHGDFVFIDPPYTVKHNLNGFIKYNEKLFAWEDQERLKLSVDRAVTRGAKVMILNAAHKSVENLYADYSQKRFSRKNVLAADPVFRGTYEELVITSWE